MTAPTRQDATVWTRLAAPIPEKDIQYRPDGKPVQRDGRQVVRQVAYIDAQLVRERLDAVVAGEWDLHLEALPAIDGDGERLYAFRARLSVLGVEREDVGQGKDYKAAASDAFKRAAVRFGIAHELYALSVRWVPVLQSHEHPNTSASSVPATAPRTVAASTSKPVTNGSRHGAADGDELPCPTCGGPMNDERATKRDAKAPDYRCRDRRCDGVRWPAKAPSSVVVADAIPF